MSDDYINAITGSHLVSAIGTPRLDDHLRPLLNAERDYIDARREKQGFTNRAQPVAALALSGGGIRSAAFALGVMQQLAKRDYLRLFDYLSTVSGGGYIGSSLTWLTSREFLEKSKGEGHPDGVRFG